METNSSDGISIRAALLERGGVISPSASPEEETVDSGFGSDPGPGSRSRLRRRRSFGRRPGSTRIMQPGSQHLQGVLDGEDMTLKAIVPITVTIFAITLQIQILSQTEFSSPYLENKKLIKSAFVALMLMVSLFTSIGYTKGNLRRCLSYATYVFAILALVGQSYAVLSN